MYTSHQTPLHITPDTLLYNHSYPHHIIYTTTATKSHQMSDTIPDTLLYNHSYPHHIIYTTTATKSHQMSDTIPDTLLYNHSYPHHIIYTTTATKSHQMSDTTTHHTRQPQLTTHIIPENHATRTQSQLPTY